REPGLLGAPVIGAGRSPDVAGHHQRRASLRHHEISDTDPWRAEATFSRQTFSAGQAMQHPLQALFAAAQAGRILTRSVSAITVGYLGVELDSAKVISTLQQDAGIPTRHGRHWVGL